MNERFGTVSNGARRKGSRSSITTPPRTGVVPRRGDDLEAADPHRKQERHLERGRYRRVDDAGTEPDVALNARDLEEDVRRRVVGGEDQQGDEDRQEEHENQRTAIGAAVSNAAEVPPAVSAVDSLGS